MISFMPLAAIGRRHVAGQSSGSTAAHPIARPPHYVFKSTSFEMFYALYSMIISGLRLHYCVVLSRFAAIPSCVIPEKSATHSLVLQSFAG
ncbi:hypothetical protein Zmor_010414 [Zophobas morio]|uniref:Uncharacterized protein n=1 Tax=Zophobas morio TaxID=2755281 RepID=A0AA38MJU9_9CUCU|nr:hypothetical protein Zmor_010414 [Zophobas morio]